MRVLVFGSRTFDDRNIVTSVLQGVYAMHELGFLLTHVSPLTIIDGAAAGADTLAREWAITPGMHPASTATDDPDVCDVLLEEFPADWAKYGKRAGPIRNQQMLDEGKPDMGIGFVDKPLPESRGSYDMAKRLKAAGIPTYIIERYS